MTWALSQTQRPAQERHRWTPFIWFDAVTSLVAVSFIVFLTTRLHWWMKPAQPLVTIAVVWSLLVLALWASRVYREPRRNVVQAAREIGKALLVVLVGILVVEALVGTWARDRMPPLLVVLALAACGAVMVSARVLGTYVQQDSGRRDRVIVVGTGVLAQDVVSRLERSADAVVIGIVDDEPIEGAQVLGSLEALPNLCRLHNVNRIVVAFSRSHPERLLPVLRALPGNVAIDLVPRYFELTGWGARIEDLSGLSLIALSPRCVPARRDRIKRVFDIMVASVVLVVVSPVLIGSAIVVALSSGRPVLFRQERVGRGRAPFRIAKFRTLSDDKELCSTNGQRPRVHSEIVAGRETGVGKWLRRTGIDELPQLLNVLAGHMSLVGPRPFIPEECWVLEGEAERRFDVRPGMTGLWQVSGQHSLRLDELVRLDVYYVDTWTFWRDLRILAKTPSRLARGGGDGVAKIVLEPSSSS